MPGDNRRETNHRVFVPPGIDAVPVDEAFDPAALETLVAGINLGFAITARIVMLPVVELT